METEARGTEMAVQPAMFSGNRHHLPWVQRIEDHGSWPVLAKVPETMTALVPMTRFTIHDLLTLEPGRVIETSHGMTEMIPMRVGAVQIAWGEFEVVENSLAMRVTKLA